LKKAIFLDRDGVINKAKVINGKPFAPNYLNEIILFPNLKNILNILKGLGYLIIVITNQPDVKRKKTSLETVIKINKFIKKFLPVDDIFICFHDNDEKCECRKPRPGNILLAAKLYNINLKDSYMIGDTWKDISAGRKAGCKTIFFDHGYNLKKPKNYDFLVKSMKEIIKIISIKNKKLI
jgi:D-glycero-D-manno-heptose 1,7-bisphosphate phosphatase